MNKKAWIAELIGTFALVFVGAGAGAVAKGGLGGIALAHGFIWIGLAAAYGRISGAHFNPAVTFGVLTAGRMKLADAGGYVVCQLAGGILAALAIKGAMGANADTYGATVLSADFGTIPAQGLLIEAVLTFLLVTVFLHVMVEDRGSVWGGLAVGLTLAGCMLMGGPLTGASLNPARTLGPGIFTGSLSQYWIYLLGPLTGAAAAAGVWRYALGEGAVPNTPTAIPD